MAKKAAARRAELGEPYKRDTLWRLVSAHCAQLGDASAAARLPFLLGLTWALIWMWALYTVELGHTVQMRSFYRTYYLQSQIETEPGRTAFNKFCNETLLQQTKQPHAIPESVARTNCQEIVKVLHTSNEEAFRASTLISFPGGFARISVADLAVLGQTALLVILSWQFFAVRRMNHAVRALVDLDVHSRRLSRWAPPSFVLEPQIDYLSAEHYAFAYQSVAQRFVFIFSQHSRPLLLYTVLLTVLPALVASWNMYTDFRDVTGHAALFPQLAKPLIYKLVAEVLLVAMVWALTIAIARREVDTSVLLNGWSLAVRDVWARQWNEQTDETASSVKVDVNFQTAKPVEPDENNDEAEHKAG